MDDHEAGRADGAPGETPARGRRQPTAEPAIVVACRKRHFGWCGRPPSLNICATLAAVTVYRITFEGPAALALRVATALADADGVELTSSEPPSVVDVDTVTLGLAVEGEPASVTDAVTSIRDALPAGASIEVADD
jgi:hypothetical protein